MLEPYLIEIDTHALKLEVGSAIVAEKVSRYQDRSERIANVHTRAVKAVLAGDDLPATRLVHDRPSECRV